MKRAGRAVEHPLTRNARAAAHPQERHFRSRGTECDRTDALRLRSEAQQRARDRHPHGPKPLAGSVRTDLLVRIEPGRRATRTEFSPWKIQEMSDIINEELRSK
jgi:hypothetical protein